jgi:four helix bundle protein
VQDFRELQVWRKAHQLTLTVYRATGAFPADERYGLVAQMRRAASSIGCNIAEGCGREGGADFARFLQLAAGSASELEYQLLLSADLKLLASEGALQLQTDTQEVKRMLVGLITSVRSGVARRADGLKRGVRVTEN